MSWFQLKKIGQEKNRKLVKQFHHLPSLSHFQIASWQRQPVSTFPVWALTACQSVNAMPAIYFLTMHVTWANVLSAMEVWAACCPGNTASIWLISKRTSSSSTALNIQRSLTCTSARLAIHCSNVPPPAAGGPLITYCSSCRPACLLPWELKWTTQYIMDCMTPSIKLGV